MSIEMAIVAAVINGDRLAPQLSTSSHYKHWITVGDGKQCAACQRNHGKIWMIFETPYPQPPVHPKCRCIIECMQAIKAGTATINGLYGADWMLKYTGALPNDYVLKKDLELLGWRRGREVSKFAAGKIFCGGAYKNADQHLPQISGREWYEADINYRSGKRNAERILWSNDGLIFVTYDHYKTFYEIVG